MHQPGKVDKETHERTRHNAKVFGKGNRYIRTKISRIMRDSTEPGDSFEWTEPDINNISIVLQLGTQGRDKLRYTIYPELVCYDAALENREGIIRLNCRLAEHGFPLIETKI